jgi:hypothetical protein
MPSLTHSPMRNETQRTTTRARLSATRTTTTTASSTASATRMPTTSRTAMRMWTMRRTRTVTRSATQTATSKAAPRLRRRTRARLRRIARAVRRHAASARDACVSYQPAVRVYVCDVYVRACVRGRQDLTGSCWEAAGDETVGPGGFFQSRCSGGDARRREREL